MELTAALAGSAVLLAGPRHEYLAPPWPVIVTDYGATIILHLGLAFAAVAARPLRRRARRRARQSGTQRRSRRALRPARRGRSGARPRAQEGHRG